MNLLKQFANYNDILLCPTPAQWIKKAVDSLDTLLIDHANCEKKAAATAMNLMFRYVDNLPLQQKMSRIAREELRHYEQVLALMEKRDIQYKPLSAAGYAEKLRKPIRTVEPAKLMDTLIVGALIEARSCERFAALSPHLESFDPDLARYYLRLCKSEARHFQDYLLLALDTGEETEINDRIKIFAEAEHEAISSGDTRFRFHSGRPSM